MAKHRAEDRDGVGDDGLLAPVTWKGYDYPTEGNMQITPPTRKRDRVIAAVRKLAKR